VCVCVCVCDESPKNWSIHIRHGWDTVTCERTSRCVQIETSNTCSFLLASCILRFHCVPNFHCLNWLNFPWNFVEWTRRLRNRIRFKESMFVCIIARPSQPVYLRIAPSGRILPRCGVLMQLEQGTRRYMRSHCQDCANLGNVSFSHPVECFYSLYHLFLTLALQIISAKQWCIMAPTSVNSFCVNKPRYVVPRSWRKYISMSGDFCVVVAIFSLLSLLEK
jgi:hypothetical protein